MEEQKGELFSNWQQHLYVQPEVHDDPHWDTFTEVVDGLLAREDNGNMPGLCMASAQGNYAIGLGGDQKLRRMSAKLSLAVSIALLDEERSSGNSDFSCLCHQARQAFER